MPFCFYLSMIFSLYRVKPSIINKQWRFPKWLEEKCVHVHYRVMVLTIDTPLRTPVDKTLRNYYWALPLIKR